MKRKSSNSPSVYTDEDVRRVSGAPPINSEREGGWTPFNKDYARLVHAPSFRRLQGKTQLLPGIEDDFFRNRLTHSLEVSQIAAGIAGGVNVQLVKSGFGLIDLALVQFAALAHDLGHPPFGHNGEEALDELMLSAGGFEGNAQTLHILASVESKLITLPGGRQRSDVGLDLTYRTLASVLKYDALIPARRKMPGVVKGYYQQERELVRRIKEAVAPSRTRAFKTIECSIMDIADDIAYSTYDLEDTLHAQFVTPGSLLGALFHDDVVRASVFKKTNSALRKAGHRQIRNDTELFESAIKVIPAPRMPSFEAAALAKLPKDSQEAWNAVNVCAINSRLVEDVVSRTAFTAERVGRLIGGIEFHLDRERPAMSSVRLARDELIDVELFKHLNFELVIRSPRLAIPERRGKKIVTRLFTELVEANGELLRENWKELYQRARTKEGKMRVVCDFVAGMTDRYAVELHDALFGAGKTIFKPH
jgi:dGTPase